MLDFFTGTPSQFGHIRLFVFGGDDSHHTLLNAPVNVNSGEAFTPLLLFQNQLNLFGNTMWHTTGARLGEAAIAETTGFGVNSSYTHSSQQHLSSVQVLYSICSLSELVSVA